jgi:hypothetical protein
VGDPVLVWVGVWQEVAVDVQVRVLVGVQVRVPVKVKVAVWAPRGQTPRMNPRVVTAAVLIYQRVIILRAYMSYFPDTPSRRPAPNSFPSFSKKDQ